MVIGEKQGVRVIEKIKWLATVCLIIGFGGVASGIYEFIFLQLIGGSLWLSASFLMNDKALIVTNSFMTLAGVLGIAIHYS